MTMLTAQQLRLLKHMMYFNQRFDGLILKQKNAFVLKPLVEVHYVYLYIECI